LLPVIDENQFEDTLNRLNSSKLENERNIMKKSEPANQGYAPPNSAESIVVEYSIRVHGGGDPIAEVTNKFEIPMALHQGHQPSVMTAYLAVFEQLVQLPLQMRLNEYLGKHYQDGRKQNVSQPAFAAEPAASRATSAEPSETVLCDPQEPPTPFGSAIPAQSPTRPLSKLRAAA
jgi:hypothetical protein